MTRGIILALLALSSAGCQMVGRVSPTQPPVVVPPPASPGPHGMYSGSFQIEGGETAVNLNLTRRGDRDLLGVLVTPDGIRAEGAGSLRGQEIRLELRYGGDCPGTMVLVGEWNQETNGIQGVVRASDCTGQAEGTFQLIPG
ncbi:hypothetical protein ACFL5A_04060 [Gemmatimonadota bacterium]